IIHGTAAPAARPRHIVPAPRRAARAMMSRRRTRWGASPAAWRKRRRCKSRHGKRPSLKASTRPRRPITAPPPPSRCSIRSLRATRGGPPGGSAEEALARPPRSKREPPANKATADALETLIREGRPEFRKDDGTMKVWTPHRPPRPEKSEGGVRFEIKSDYQP